MRASGELAALDVLELAREPTVEVMAALEMHGSDVDAVIFGNVSRPVKYHNLAREIVFAADLDRSIPAYTVSLACASSCQAFTNATDMIERSYADTVIAGGVESLSNVSFQYTPKLARTLVATSRAKTPLAKARTFATVRMSDLAPVAPAIKETSTGLSMGESAELMAKLNGIGREEQDEFALVSHMRAQAEKDSRQQELAPVYLNGSRAKAIVDDNQVRADTTREKLAALPPVFDPGYGTVTAGNSSPLTDGAATMLVMREEHARGKGYAPVAVVRSYAYAAVDPAGQLLLGPVYAIPMALDRAGLQLSDIDVFEMHEAFAAQVLSTVRCLESTDFAQAELGRPAAVGTVDRDTLNVGGGSIALGHPFGATGIRVLMDLARHLQERDGTLGLASVCAAGGVGCAIVLERAS